MSSDTSSNPDIFSTPDDSPNRYGTFTGVFMPTFIVLAIFLYLRLGWTVGNAGLLGGLLIILLCFGITGTTGLAMSSITTNIRIGAGGPYSIISQSLGLEVGGSVGIPLYLAQALIITLYIFGFREGWLMVFPDHQALAVDLITFGVLCAVTYISTALAFKLQYVVLVIIVASLGAVAVGAATGPLVTAATMDVELWGSFEDASFWGVFAVFFPAATGITVGANMSGELKNPRRSIPIGTMAAIGTALALYILIAIWLALSVSPEAMRSDLLIVVSEAVASPLVLAALLAGTFSSALASMVGAPRILQALAGHKLLPAAHWLSRRRGDGEPRNAWLITAIIAFFALVVRDLNAIAPLITMFFLITYMMINLVVFFEQTLDLVSFRPLLRVPRLVSAAGFLGSLFAMFIISPTFSLVALALVVGAYVLMVRRSFDAPYGDLRSGMFVTLAEWAAKRVNELPQEQERAWKPNLLVAVQDTRQLRGAFLFIRDLVVPRGSVKMVGIHPEDNDEHFADDLDRLAANFRSHQVFADWVTMSAPDFTTGIITGIQNARGHFPRPNIVFLQMPEELETTPDYLKIVERASAREMGTILYAHHPQADLGRRQTVNIWLRDRTPDWSISMDIGNLDLSILIAYKLRRNWNAQLRLIMVVEDEAQQERARQFLEQLLTLARIPNAEIVINTGQFTEQMAQAPQADLNIFGMISNPDLDFARRMMEKTDSSCIFVRDSGQESALA